MRCGAAGRMTDKLQSKFCCDSTAKWTDSLVAEATAKVNQFLACSTTSTTSSDEEDTKIEASPADTSDAARELTGTTDS